MIRLKDVEKTYENGTEALQGISFTIEDGEFVFLVGPSGSGKSTIIKLLTGEVIPTAGRVMVNGFSMSRISDRQIPYMRRTIGVIFQDFRLIPKKTVFDNLSLAMRAVGATPRDIRTRIPYVLELVGLKGMEDRYPDELSGGEQQRVAIARALVTRPELVVCDEAVSALDASVQAQVLNLLKEVQADFGLTYFFISHDLSVVGYMSDRVAVMYLGRIVEQADRNTLFGSAAHPYTKALLAAAPVHDPAKRRIRAFLPGELPSPFSPPAGCAFHPRCPQAMPRCREEAPELREIAPDHLARCHLYG